MHVKQALPAGIGGRCRTKSPVRFFVLVFALSTPFWLLGAVTRRQLSADLPISSFIWVCPAIAASILVSRDNGTAGVAELLRRSFDYKRARAKGWYAVIVVLMPGVFALTYGVMRLLGLPLPTVRLALLAALGVFLGYFVAGQFEELGWSGYALDRLQERWTALPAALLLGVVCAVFHYVPLVQHGRSAGWIAWWSLLTVALRVLFTCLQQHRQERLRRGVDSRGDQPGLDRPVPGLRPTGVPVPGAADQRPDHGSRSHHRDPRMGTTNTGPVQNTCSGPHGPVTPSLGDCVAGLEGRMDTTDKPEKITTGQQPTPTQDRKIRSTRCASLLQGSVVRWAPGSSRSCSTQATR